MPALIGFRETGEARASFRGAPRAYVRLALSFLLGFTAVVRMEAACFTAPAGIVGWWPADGNANDVIGTNNGTLQGGATASAAGLVSSAFSFDGTNGYVQIPDSPALRPTNLTVEAWVRFNSLESAGTAPAGQQYIVFKQNSRTYNFEGYNLAKLRTPGGDVLSFIVESAAGQLVQLQSATLVTTGVWYHVAGVRGSNFAQLYVNGQLESQTNVSFPQDYGNFPLYFGSSGQSYWDGKLNGLLDEVTLYDRALSANEVAAIYLASAGGKCKPGNPPSIAFQPQSQTVMSGTNAVFAVAANGWPPLSYQWQFNGADISNATGTSLTLTGVQPTDAGSYTVVVSNPSGPVTSAVAVLTVLVPPVIADQPTSLTVVAGAEARFSVTASGTLPLKYQWRFSGADLAGATGPGLTLSDVQPANAGSYTVVVTNTAGSVTSDLASLTVLVPPAITAPPADLSVASGADAEFSVTASGTPPLSYQWQFNGTELAGATGTSLLLVGVQATNIGPYTVVVTNLAGSVTSAVAVLTLLGPPAIIVQPTNLNVAVGANATFSVTASGTPPLSFQWRFNGADVPGATDTSLTLPSVQLTNAGSYAVVVTNTVGSVTSAVASLLVYVPTPPGSRDAGAVVLVNSQSARYLDFQHFIQPYLDNFGFPYTVQDIATNPPGPSLTNCAVIIIGHSQLDTNLAYLSGSAQASLSLAVSNGTGLVSFDNDLFSGDAPRYQFVQEIFGFGYSPGGSGSSATLPATEPSSQMHFITARHPTNDVVTFRSSLSLPGMTVPLGATALAWVGGQPLVTVTQFGQGRAVQWGSYDWMVPTVLGPVDGLDDLVWRGVVWAARKPFVMRGLPNFVTMRVDDAYGPFGWAHAANAVGFKPFIALFYKLVSESSAADLAALTTNGQATTSIHSTDTSDSFFYFNHATEKPWPDDVQSNNFYQATLWHTNHGIPISKICATHFSEIGTNCFSGLKAWGMEFVPIEVVPGTLEYGTPNAPWLMAGPYRLYETPEPGQVNWPTYYADWLKVPGHPEFDGQFFDVYSEVRDVSGSCDEWCPDNDVAGSISRGVAMAKRTLDSLVMTTLFTHELKYVSQVSPANWQAILQGVTNGLAPYNPIYVTLDYASQYVRATRTSRLMGGAFDPQSGHVMATLSGKTDLDLTLYCFLDESNSITSTSATVPIFSGSITTLVATLPTQPVPPQLITPPASLTTNAGATVAFTVRADGTAHLTYQWLENQVPLADGGNVSGAMSPSLVLSRVSPKNAGDYTVVITNVVGSVTSPPASLTVIEVPLISSITPLPDKNIALELPAVSNFSCRIDASADLSNWATLTNFPSQDGMFQFIDLDATNFPRRFYRAVWVP